MKLTEVLGSFILALAAIYFAWVLMAQNSVERIIRSCEPVYFISKPFSSISKLWSMPVSRNVSEFFFEREKDCRFVMYDMFYADDEKQKASEEPKAVK